MVSDFFFPGYGGVESHIYDLSHCLVKLGHKVVIITHSRNDRQGVRYLTSGVKVYYIPHWVVYDQVSLPTIYTTLPIFRHIFIREQIELVHGHQAFSPMCHEAIIHARTMGLFAVFTDHSLCGFHDTGQILTNKLLEFTLSDINHVICVSHTSKENTVLRASLDPRNVSVLPNAIISASFKPGNLPAYQKGEKMTIVVVGRMTYRRGTDLLVAAIPLICKEFDHVDFVIGTSV